jgi:hypothetical protein
MPIEERALDRYVKMGCLPKYIGGVKDNLDIKDDIQLIVAEIHNRNE